MQAVRVRLVSDDPDWCADRARELAPVPDIVVTTSVRLAGLQAAPDSPGVVVLVDGSPNLEQALEAIAAQSRAFPGSACVLVAPAGLDAATVYPRAALAGVRVVLAQGCELPEMAEAIYRAADTVAAAAAPGAAPGSAGSGSRGDRTVVLFGTKGGVGKTTLAVNLGALLARRGLRTALLDLHFDWGTASVLLRGVPPRPFSELLTETSRLDADLLQSFMVRHDSGVFMLPPPPRPEMAEFVTPAHVTAIVAAARDAFDVVIADTPAGFPATVFPALEAADHLLAVTTPDVPALRNLRAALKVLELLQCSHAKVHLVCNRITQTFGVRRADVEATLGIPIWAALPTDTASVVRGSNEGLPVAVLAPGSRYARAVAAIAQQLAPERRLGAGTPSRASARGLRPRAARP